MCKSLYCYCTLPREDSLLDTNKLRVANRNLLTAQPWSCSSLQDTAVSPRCIFTAQWSWCLLTPKSEIVKQWSGKNFIFYVFNSPRSFSLSASHIWTQTIVTLNQIDLRHRFPMPRKAPNWNNQLKEKFLSVSCFCGQKSPQHSYSGNRISGAGSRAHFSRFNW